LLRLLQAEIGLLGTQQWLVGYRYWEEAQGICSSERIQSTGTSIPNWNCWDSRNEYDILLVTVMNEQTNPHSTPDIHHDILWWTPIYSLLLWILMTSVFLTTYKRIVLILSSTPKHTKKNFGCQIRI
jgi:hypothetical protein